MFTSDVLKRGVGLKKDAGQSRNQLLLEAAAQREKRSIAAKQAAAAIKVQAVVRSFRSRCTTVFDVARSWDSKLTDIIKVAHVLAGAGKQFVVPTSLLVAICRQYPWAVRLHRDAVAIDRLDSLALVFEASSASIAAGAFRTLSTSDGRAREDFAGALCGLLKGAFQVVLRQRGIAFIDALAGSEKLVTACERLERAVLPLLVGSGACSAALHFMASPTAAAALDAVQLALLHACARADADSCIRLVYSHPAVRLLVAVACASIGIGPGDGVNEDSGRAGRAAGRFGRYVLPLPFVTQQVLSHDPKGLPMPIMVEVASSPSWPYVLASLRHQQQEEEEQMNQPLASVRASFTLANVVDVHIHAHAHGPSMAAFVDALTLLLHKVPHVIFALQGAALARERAVQVHAGGGVLDRAENEREGGEEGAEEDAALAYGDTDEALQAAAERSADLALACARRTAAAALAAAISSNRGGGLASQAQVATTAAGATSGTKTFLSPTHAGQSSSFSGSSNHMFLYQFGTPAANSSVTAKLQQGRGHGREGGTGASAGVVSPSPAPARPARVPRLESMRDQLRGVVDQHTAALLALLPLHTQLAAVVSPVIVGSLLRQAAAAGPVAAVEALSLLQSLQEKLRLATYLRWHARVVQVQVHGGSVGGGGGGSGYEESTSCACVRIEASADSRGTWMGLGSVQSQGLASALLPDSASLMRSLVLPNESTGEDREGDTGTGVPASLLHAAWRAVSAHPELRRFTSGSACDALTSFPALGSALTLLHEAVAWAGEEVDDTSWCDEGCPMPLMDTRALLSCTRSLLYRLAWADRTAMNVPLSKRPYPVLALTGPALAALNGLYDRHVRRPGWLAGARTGTGAVHGKPAGEAEAGDALFLWPTLPASDLCVESVLGLEDVAVADEGMTAPSLGSGDVETVGAGEAGEREEGRLAALEAAIVAQTDGIGGGGDVSGQSHGMSWRTRRANRLLLVLTTCPQVIPFATRVSLFTALREREKAGQGQGWGMGRISFTVRRAHLVPDAFTAFSTIVRMDHSGQRLKERFQIGFVNTAGEPEAGIDGGGLLKEFVDSVVRASFHPDTGLFRATPGGRVYPNPDPLPGTVLGPEWDGMSKLCPGGRLPTPHELYEFLGMLLGKALFEGILVEPRFAPFVLRRLLGKAVVVDDLAGYDVELYRSLMGVQSMAREALLAGAGQEGAPDPVEDLGITFSVTDVVGGHPVTVPLVPGGEGVTVTAARTRAYVARLARYRLHTCAAGQVRAFLRGFRMFIPLPWMRMFGPGELAVLLGGRETAGFDVSDLRAHTEYQGGYHADHPQIRALWRVLEGMDPADQTAFLAFVTSVPRPPLLGFGSLFPRFGVARVPISRDSDKLPLAATCFNMLKLPTYSTEKVLKEKLLYAIHAGAGFELS